MLPDPRSVRGGFLLSAFGLGRLRIAAGTWTALATAVAIGSAHFALDLGLATAGLLFAFGCLTTVAFGRIVDPHAAAGAVPGTLDPSWVVTDEVAGQAVACAGALLHDAGLTPLAVSFFAFRLLDILKPGPIDRLQRLPGGQGVLYDDLLAGLLAGGIAWGSTFLSAGVLR